MKKIFLKAEELLQDSFQLGLNVIDSKYNPTILVILWRGGAPIGIAIHELMKFYGFNIKHEVLKTSSYKNLKQSKNIHIENLEHLINKIVKTDKLLFIDDIFDTGRTYEAILSGLREECSDNYPQAIRLATPWFKPTKNKTTLAPDYYLYETDEWVVFPHEIESLSKKELREHRILLSNRGIEKLI